MRASPDLELLKRIEGMLIREMECNGRIMVRSIDKIHATTGLTYAAISEVARRVEDRVPARSVPA